MLNSHHLPWGKHRESGDTHRLEHHCADVACCFEALVAEPVLRDRFDKAAGGEGLDDVTLARLSVLAFLHDFGKISAGFQLRIAGDGSGTPERANHIDAAIWACHRPKVIKGFGLDALAGWGEPGLQEWLLAALAHHGRPISRKKLGDTGRESSWRPCGGYDPIAAGRVLFGCARQWFPEAFSVGPALPKKPALVHLFAGTLALADQIGSNEELFEFEPNLDPHYIGRARERAAKAVRRLGFSRTQWIAETSPTEFDTLFPGWSPRPLQKAVVEAPPDCPLLILEGETGSGKTEAAIWRFAVLWQAGLVDGLYFALPTRAAAVQLHDRVNRALSRLFPTQSGLGTVLAVPGYFRVGDSSGWRIGKYEVVWRDDPDDGNRLARWSAESARKFLAATAAVGTVDQALLSGLRVKWAHFRGSAMARSLLVVDEIHASDAYMTEVLRGVLRSHLEIGGHALLMSATLGSEARDALMYASATARQPTTGLREAKVVHYPVLALADPRKPPRLQPIAVVRYKKAVSMTQRPILKEPSRIAELAIREAGKGAKILLVRNTVKGAQAVFGEVREKGAEGLLLQAGGGPVVHHSRFAVEDRKRLDAAVEGELGKGRKPGGCIVIGTQTLEQSLDIDADLLITDLCPVDVLLQRIGRLHRHESGDRPEGCRDPKCVVLVPEGGLDSEGLLAHGMGMSRNGGIYRDLRVLELTRRLVTRHTVWKIPEMNRGLVEEGTHPDKLEAIGEEMSSVWEEMSLEVDGRAAAERQIARHHMLGRWKDFSSVDFPGRDEQVRTRLGDDGPRIRLAQPVTGPFGQEVTTFNLPVHMFRRSNGLPTAEQIETARADAVPGGLLLTVGAYRFEYGRAGIRRMG